MTHVGIARPSTPTGVYFVADHAVCGDRGLVDATRAAVAAGVGTVQVRDKTGSAARQLELVTAVARAVGDRALVIVDDRIDVFLAARASGAPVHGVHIGQDDLPAPLARRLIGTDAVLGLSAQTSAQFAAVERLPAGCVDYLGVGAVRETATKPDHPPALGVDGIGELAASTALPCVAIGGIRASDLPALRRAGAVGAAVASAIGSAEDPRRAARSLVAAWGE